MKSKCMSVCIQRLSPLTRSQPVDVDRVSGAVDVLVNRLPAPGSPTAADSPVLDLEERHAKTAQTLSENGRQTDCNRCVR